MQAALKNADNPCIGSFHKLDIGHLLLGNTQDRTPDYTTGSKSYTSVDNATDDYDILGMSKVWI